MRLYWILVGVWCGSGQLGLIYGLSFLWSATPLTAVWVLFSWLGGAMGGLQRPAKGSGRRWLWPCLPLLAWWLAPWLPPQILLICSFSGGWMAGSWLLDQECRLLQALRWESLGMGIGYLITGWTAYRGLNSVLIWQLLCTGVLYWRERHWLDGDFARSR